MLAALLAAGAADAADPRPNLRLGLWRVDVEMTLPGKGPNTDGAVSQEICLTAANISQVVMPQNPYCNGRVTKLTAGEMDWKMVCNQAGTETFSRAHAEFAGEKFAVAILTTAKQFNMEFKTVLRGKYLKACSAEQTRDAFGPVRNPPKPKKEPAAPAPEKDRAPLQTYKP